MEPTAPRTNTERTSDKSRPDVVATFRTIFSKIFTGASPTADDLSKYFAVFTGALTTVATFFGGLTGLIPRVIRNHTGWSYSVLGTLLVGGALGLVSMGVPKSPLRVVMHLFTGCLLTFAVAMFGFGAIRMINSGDIPRAELAVEKLATGGYGVSGIARASGFDRNRMAYVRVVGFLPPDTSIQWVEIYHAWVGPNQDGLIEHPFKAPIPDGVRIVTVAIGSDAGQAKACTPADADLESLIVTTSPSVPSLTETSSASATGSTTPDEAASEEVIVELSSVPEVTNPDPGIIGTENATESAGRMTCAVVYIPISAPTVSATSTPTP